LLFVGLYYAGQARRTEPRNNETPQAQPG